MVIESDEIAEVGIDEQQRLYLQPSTLSFPLIYREAADVHWDAERRRLHSSPPRKWTYLQWFRHILNTVGPQRELRITPATKWVNVPLELRREIDEWLASKPAEPSLTEQGRQQQDQARRERNYHATQEPRLKAQARELFMQGHYAEVTRIESEIRYPEFLSGSERRLFDLARKRQRERDA